MVVGRDLGGGSPVDFVVNPVALTSNNAWFGPYWSVVVGIDHLSAFKAVLMKNLFMLIYVLKKLNFDHHSQQPR